LFYLVCKVYRNLDYTLPRRTYLLTPWNTALLEKLTGFQLVNKFLAFYGTRRFITVFTVPATCPYPEPARSSPYPHIFLSQKDTLQKLSTTDGLFSKFNCGVSTPNIVSSGTVVRLGMMNSRNADGSSLSLRKVLIKCL